MSRNRFQWDRYDRFDGEEVRGSLRFLSVVEDRSWSLTDPPRTTLIRRIRPRNEGANLIFCQTWHRGQGTEERRLNNWLCRLLRIIRRTKTCFRDLPDLTLRIIRVSGMGGSISYFTSGEVVPKIGWWLVSNSTVNRSPQKTERVGRYKSHGNSRVLVWPIGTWGRTYKEFDRLKRKVDTYGITEKWLVFTCQKFRVLIQKSTY